MVLWERGRKVVWSPRSVVPQGVGGEEGGASALEGH